MLSVPKAEIQQIFNIFYRAVTHMKTAAEALGTRRIIVFDIGAISFSSEEVAISAWMFDNEEAKDGGAGDSSCLKNNLTRWS